MRRFLICLVFLASGGCRSCSRVVPQPADEPVVSPKSTTVVPTQAGSLDDLRKGLERVHFAFDSSQLTHQGRDALARDAALLQRHPDVTVQIDGHCDERGTVEYNLALGAQRAATVQQYLVQQGIAGTRLHTGTFGEERPMETGHDEGAWAQNRRAELVLGGAWSRP